jgi:hypothetical protein
MKTEQLKYWNDHKILYERVELNPLFFWFDSKIIVFFDGK